MITDSEKAMINFTMHDKFKKITLTFIVSKLSENDI